MDMCRNRRKKRSRDKERYTYGEKPCRETKRKIECEMKRCREIVREIER
jgi:hypothetical protein